MRMGHARVGRDNRHPVSLGVRLRPARIAAIGGALLVSALFGYLALRNIRYDETWHALRSIDYLWLFPTVSAVAVSVAARAARWRVLFEPGRRPRLWETTKATLLGLFFNSILPLRAGEAARIVALKRYAAVPLAESTATVAVERLFDVLALLLLLFVTTPWLPHVAWLRSAALLGIVLLVALIGAIAAVVLLGDRPVRLLLRPVMKLPGLHDLDVDRVAVNVNRGLSPLRRAGHGLLGFAWTVVSWLVIALSIWSLMVGFGLHLSFLAALLATVAVGLAFIVPAAPSAIGVFEAAAIAATKAYGVPQSQGLAYALALHALNLFPFIAAGLVLLATLPRPSALKRADDAA
jgi:glycosyltransferase 2 family protein